MNNNELFEVALKERNDALTRIEELEAETETGVSVMRYREITTLLSLYQGTVLQLNDRIVELLQPEARPKANFRQKLVNLGAGLRR